MRTVERIRKLGFRRWYERTLIESHAHLVTCFLGMVLAMAGVETIGTRQGLAQLIYGAAVGGGGIALTIFGWRRYHRLLMLAEHLGAGATCRACGTYAIFRLLSPAASTDTGTEGDPDEEPVRLRVRCRECGHEWTIE
jgi:hypothetical protein